MHSYPHRRATWVGLKVAQRFTPCHRCHPSCCNVWTSAGLGIGLFRQCFDHVAPLHSRCDATPRALAACFTPLVFSLLALVASPSGLRPRLRRTLNTTHPRRPTPQARATSTPVNPTSRATCTTPGPCSEPYPRPSRTLLCIESFRTPYVRSFILLLS